MGYNRRAGEGTSVAVGVSRDAGAMWSWKVVSKNRFDDRPWVEVAPDGTAHVIWNDGAGVNHLVSRDRGASWAKIGHVHDRGCSSHLAVKPNGEVAVRVTPLIRVRAPTAGPRQTGPVTRGRATPAASTSA